MTDQIPESQTDQLLGLILDELVKLNQQNEPANPPGIFRISSTATADHVGMRVKEVIFSVTDAATVTLYIGTASYAFSVGGAGIYTVALPLIIRGGIDVSMDVSAGTLTSAFIVADVE